MSLDIKSLLSKKLNEDYYSSLSTLELASNLLGKALVLKQGNDYLVGEIVETEAYLNNDEASHAFKGKTLRNAAMFLNAGHAYVYYIYGNYYCFNVVSSSENIGEAVLIRALEPIYGIEQMLENRINSAKSKIINKQNFKLENLCNGPAKLTMAYGINSEFNSIKLWENLLFLCEFEDIQTKKIFITKRVGITKAADLDYRFYIKNNKFISKK